MKTHEQKAGKTNRYRVNDDPNYWRQSSCRRRNRVVVESLAVICLNSLNWFKESIEEHENQVRCILFHWTALVNLSSWAHSLAHGWLMRICYIIFV